VKSATYTEKNGVRDLDEHECGRGVTSAAHSLGCLVGMCSIFLTLRHNLFANEIENQKLLISG
jgi:hypothetical protein